MKFLTRFDKSPRPVIDCALAVRLEIEAGVEKPQEARTKPEFLPETDINLIMARYKKTGILPESALSAAARYGDFSQIPSFAEIQQKLIAANELFLALPATVRRQFDNDPGEFIAASQTPEGQDLMIKLGLGKPLEPQEPLQEMPPAPAPVSRPEGAKRTPKASKTEVSDQESE